MPLFPFLGEGSPTKMDYRKKIGYQLILSSLLEDLDKGAKGARNSGSLLGSLIRQLSELFVA